MHEKTLDPVFLFQIYKSLETNGFGKNLFGVNSCQNNVRWCCSGGGFLLTFRVGFYALDTTYTFDNFNCLFFLGSTPVCEDIGRLFFKFICLVLVHEYYFLSSFANLDPLSANPTKWSNTQRRCGDYC